MAILNKAFTLAAVASALAGAGAGGGCYDPMTRECALTCAGSGDCGEGQTCGADHLCHSPGVSCEGTDTRPDAPAAPVDAGPPPPTVTLHVTIAGNGSVVVDGQQSCVATEQGMSGKFTADCMIAVTDASHALVATDGDGGGPGNGHFYMWSGDCSGTATTCTIAAQPTMITVGAFFQ